MPNQSIKAAVVRGFGQPLDLGETIKLYMKRPIHLFLASAAMLMQSCAQQTPPVFSAPHPEAVAPAAAAAGEPDMPQRSEAELDQLLAPVALHPDPLLAQILPAATQPTDIVLAARYLRDKKDPAKIDEQPWDPSVKALARFPTVINLMSDDLAWTVVLGSAFFEEPDAVMDSVQRLRLQAQALGNLPETKEQKVIIETVEQQTIVKIIPADFALVAWPAQWNESGVMTFIVNQQGKVFQKNLGPQTAATVSRMKAYDPDDTWSVVQE